MKKKIEAYSISFDSDDSNEGSNNVSVASEISEDIPEEDGQRIGHQLQIKLVNLQELQKK